MKSEFQKILECYLGPIEVQTPKGSSFYKESQDYSFPLYLYIQPKTINKFGYKQTSREEIYSNLKLKWSKQVTQPSEIEAIEFFYQMGARDFLKRDMRSLKRDYRNLALKYHPDYYYKTHSSSEECPFLKIKESYNILISLCK